MAKKNDNTKYALLALLLGVGGYFVYKKWKDSKGDKPELDTTEEDVILAVEQAKQAQSGKTFSPYEIQIMQLQAWLQIAIDGIAGKQTLGKLDYYWANYAKPLDFEKAKADNYPELRANGYGLLSPTNISQYIANLNAGTSPRQKFWKSSTATTTASSTDSARIAKGSAIITTWRSSATKKLKFTAKGSYPIYYKNSSGTLVKSTSWFNSTYNVGAGETITPVWITLGSNGILIVNAKPISGDPFYIYVSPYQVTNA